MDEEFCEERDSKVNHSGISAQFSRCCISGLGFERVWVKVLVMILRSLIEVLAFDLVSGFPCMFVLLGNVLAGKGEATWEAGDQLRILVDIGDPLRAYGTMTRTVKGELFVLVDLGLEIKEVATCTSRR